MAIWYTKKKKQKKNDQKLFVQCYFDGDIKLLVCINICIRNFSQCYFEEDTYYFQLYQHYNLCQCLFEINKMYCYSYLFALFQSVLLKLQGLSIMPEQFRTGSQSKKCYKMIEWKQRVQKLRRFDVETTQKILCGELIDISSILKVQLTSNRCHNFHELSTWNFDVESMANRRRCVHLDNTLGLVSVLVRGLILLAGSSSLDEPGILFLCLNISTSVSVKLVRPDLNVSAIYLVFLAAFFQNFLNA